MAERVFNFRQQLQMSEGVSLSFDFREVLLTEMPNATEIRRANQLDDRSGTDWWVDRHNNRPLSVDLKAREHDCRKYGNDDLALETWSVVEKRIIGWTRNSKKATDYILWFWNDTRRWCLVPFPMLCRVFSLLWQDWASIYRTEQQQTDRNGEVYHSECVFVPREVVWDNIVRHYSPAVVATQQVT